MLVCQFLHRYLPEETIAAEAERLRELISEDFKDGKDWNVGKVRLHTATGCTCGSDTNSCILCLVVLHAQKLWPKVSNLLRDTDKLFAAFKTSSLRKLKAALTQASVKFEIELSKFTAPVNGSPSKRKKSRYVPHEALEQKADDVKLEVREFRALNVMEAFKFMTGILAMQVLAPFKDGGDFHIIKANRDELDRIVSEIDTRKDAALSSNHVLLDEFVKAQAAAADALVSRSSVVLQFISATSFQSTPRLLPLEGCHRRRRFCATWLAAVEVPAIRSNSGNVPGTGRCVRSWHHGCAIVKMASTTNCGFEKASRIVHQQDPQQSHHKRKGEAPRRNEDHPHGKLVRHDAANSSPSRIAFNYVLLCSWCGQSQEARIVPETHRRRLCRNTAVVCRRCEVDQSHTFSDRSSPTGTQLNEHSLCR